MAAGSIFTVATFKTTYARDYLWQNIVGVGASMPLATQCCSCGMGLIPLKLYYISLDGLCNLVRIDFLFYSVAWWRASDADEL